MQQPLAVDVVNALSLLSDIWLRVVSRAASQSLLHSVLAQSLHCCCSPVSPWRSAQCRSQSPLNSPCSTPYTHVENGKERQTHNLSANTHAAAAQPLHCRGVTRRLLGAAAQDNCTHCIKPCRFMAPSVTLVTTACVSRKLIQPIPAAVLPLKLPYLTLLSAPALLLPCLL